MMIRVLLYVIFLSAFHSAATQLVNGGAYRIENKYNSKQMTTQPLTSGSNTLAYVVTAEWTFGMEQTWGVEFDGNQRTLTPGKTRENNVSVEAVAGSSFLTSVLYNLENLEANEYYIKNKKSGDCLFETSDVVHLGPCGEGLEYIWKFFRIG